MSRNTKVLVRTAQQPDYNAVPIRINEDTDTVGTLRQAAAKQLALPGCDEYTVVWHGQSWASEMELSVLQPKSTDVFVLEKKVSVPHREKRAREDPPDPRGAVDTSGPRLMVPLLYGSEAHWIGAKTPDDRTHRWTVYVRAPNGHGLR